MALSLLSATLASVGTVAVLRPSGSVATPSPAPAGSTTSVVNLDSSEAVVQVAAKASPAVVTITSSSVNTRFGPFSVPATGVGSGFVFDSNGYILTNWHVVEGGGTLTVALKDGRQLPARVVASDPDHDLAVVRVDGTNLPSVQIGSSADLQIGQLVVALGSPLGTFPASVVPPALGDIILGVTEDVTASRRAAVPNSNSPGATTAEHPIVGEAILDAFTHDAGAY